jgi:hypothetical protein
MIRRVEQLEKEFHARKRAFNTVWWMPTTWRTTIEQVLEEAVRQGLSIAAMDTEYRRSSDGKTVLTEVGFSVYRDGKITSHHYAVAGGKGAKAKRFAYGATQRYPLKKFLLEEVKSHTDAADVILFWHKTQDITALRTMGLDLPADKVVDAVEWHYKPTTEQGAGRYYNLRDFCNIQGVWHPGAHNAGNDARALLSAVLHALGVLGPPVEITERCGASN